MDLMKIRYILSIAEFRSFSKAANALFVSQPYLSRLVSEMECDLGIKIFERSRGTITLTQAGVCYLDYAKKMLALEQEAESVLSDFSSYKRGVIKIGIPFTRGSYILPQILCQFNAAYPDIHVQIEESDNHTLLEHTTSGLLNLCFFSMLEYPPEIDIEIIKEEVIYLVLPPSCDFKPADIRDNNDGDPTFSFHDMHKLDGFPFIALPENKGMGMVARQIFEQYHINPQIAYETSNVETAYRMAAYGLGATFVPEICTRFSKFDNTPHYYKIGFPPYRWSNVVAYRKSYPLNAAEKLLIQLAKKYT